MSTREDAKVVLVSMPFGPLNTPSIGLSLMQAALKNSGIHSQCLYLTLQFAKDIGSDIYSEIAGGKPLTADLVGEWLFSGALFESNREPAAGYIKEVIKNNAPGSPRRNQDLDDFILQALNVRGK